jgi:two-component system, LuxR family, sensor kinase FixL
VNEVSAAVLSPRASQSAGSTWLLVIGYLGLYLLLDWASYVEPLPHTSITPWNPNTGVLVALLLLRGARWAPVAALGIFTSELLTDVDPPPWYVLALTSSYLAAVYACATWILRRQGLQRSIDSARIAGWFAGLIGLASGIAATGYVGILQSAQQLPADEVGAAVARYWIGEFNGIIALTPLLLLKIDRIQVWDQLRRDKRELVMQLVGVLLGVGLAFALAVAHDVRLFYPLFVPVTWIALRHGVPGAMISVSLIQAAVVAALELTPGSIPLFDMQFPLLSLGLTALLIGALASDRDRTLRRLRDSDAVLQRSMRFAAAGQLASALTHELNQPMTALLSYVRSAELMTEPASTAEPRLIATLHKAAAEARRAAGVLRHLRDFYRGEVAQLQLTDSLEVCMSVAHGLQDRMRRSGIEFKLHDAIGLPQVMVDRAQLEIVIHNLLSNAIEAFDIPAARRLQPRSIEIRAQPRKTEVLIIIDDSGPGIAANVSERLFEPFVTSKVSGMGLGLSLSRTFLRHQGGDLWHEVSPLGGARFVLRLGTQPGLQSSL